MSNEEKEQLDLFYNAVVLATERHRGQKRLDGEDYINHLIRVHGSVCNFKDFIESNVCSVAMLHDILEDTDTSYNELKRLFGRDIAVSVALLTRIETIPYDVYVNLIKVSNDQDAIKVKIADLQDNLSTINGIPDEEKRERLKKRYEKALKVLINRKSDYVFSEEQIRREQEKSLSFEKEYNLRYMGKEQSENES